MHTLFQTEKYQIAFLTSRVLNQDERIILAYLCGFFVSEAHFSDIDIFVYTRKDENSFATQSGIRDTIYEAVI